MWKAVSTMMAAIFVFSHGFTSSFKASVSVYPGLNYVSFAERRFAQRRKGSQRRKESREAQKTLRFTAGHHQADLFLAHRVRIDLADEAPFVNHHHAIAQAQHFIQFSRYQQHCGPRVSKLDQLPVNELGCSNIDAASGLRHQDQSGLDI